MRFLPYEADYKLLDKCRKYSTIIFCCVCVFSVLLPVFTNFLNKLLKIYECTYFILLAAYYVLDIVTEVFIYPATARKRRQGFIDNALGSKFLEKPVENYYTNDNIDTGPYKMLVNCAENCYFTLNIAKAMIAKIVFKNVIFILIFLIMAYIGLSNNMIAIPVFQIFISSLFLTELIYHLNFVSKLNQLFERFKILFEKRLDDNEIFQQAVLMYLDYETILAYNKSPLSNSLYKKLNNKLSEEWEEIKERYKIR